MINCAGCMECCKGPRQLPISADAAKEYKSYRVFNNQGVRHYLARKDNEDCYYLGDMGCTIYQTRPDVCRDFDCRVGDHQPRIAAEGNKRRVA